jgi:hypothetical protein
MARAKTPKTLTNGKSRSKKTVVTTNGNGNSTALPLEDEIRLRAYQLYEERGCTAGDEREDWLVAERQVLAKHAGQGA